MFCLLLACYTDLNGGAVRRLIHKELISRLLPQIVCKKNKKLLSDLIKPYLTFLVQVPTSQFHLETLVSLFEVTLSGETAAKDNYAKRENLFIYLFMK